MRKDRYGFDQDWLKPDIQARVYQQFNQAGELPGEDEGYVLSHTAVDADFCLRLVDAMVEHFYTDDRILSVAEGQGHLLAELLTRDLSHVQGVDISPDNIAAAQANDLPVTLGNAHDLPFDDNTFDGVIINESIGAIGLTQALTEARRVLKSGGRFMVTAYVYLDQDETSVSELVKYHYVLPKVIIQALADHGFTDVITQSIPIHPLPEELLEQGHEGDYMSLIVAQK